MIGRASARAGGGGVSTHQRVVSPWSDGAVERAKGRWRKATNPWRVLLLLLILPVIALAIPFGVVHLRNALLEPGDVTRVVPSFWAWRGETLPVRLMPPPSVTNTPPTGAALVALDVSGSMGSPFRPGDPLHDALAAARTASSVLLATGSVVGFMPFDSSASVAVPLGRDRDALEDGWSTMRTGGGTSIASAFRAGMDHITTEGALPRNAQWEQRLLIIVSDGLDGGETVSNLVDEAKSRGISIIGIGVGATADPTFFRDALHDTACDGPMGESSPLCLNRYTCCDYDSENLTEFLLDVFVGKNMVNGIGVDGRLTDHPHVAAFPILPRESTRVAFDQGNMPPISTTEREVRFRLPVVLDPGPGYAYAVEAAESGIHALAVAPATLTYLPKGGQGLETTLVSGDAPWILVVPWWLIPLLFLPAVLFAVLIPFQTRILDIADPRILAPLDETQGAPWASTRRFRVGSMVPMDGAGHDRLRPTIVVGIGPRGGEMLAATIANRREVGLPTEGALFKPYYLDVRSLSEESMPSAMGTRLPLDCYRRLPASSDLTALVDSINRDIGAHQAVVDWLDLDAYVGKSLSLAGGVDGDRRLARLALYADLRDEAPRIWRFREEVADWIAQRERGQILLLAGGQEDVGSGWLIDVAMHLRHALGARSTPLWAILDTGSDPLNGSPENMGALTLELGMVQGEAFPLAEMDRLPGGGVDKDALDVNLPLFDQIVLPRHRDEEAPPEAVGALVLELCDEGVRAAMEERFASATWDTRSAWRRDRRGVFTEIAVDASVMPLAEIRRTWATWATRAAVLIWLGLEWDRDQLIPLPGGDGLSDEPHEVWAEIERVLAGAPKLRTWSVWMAVFTQGPDVEEVDPIQARLDLVQLLVAYLNAGSNPGLSGGGVEFARLRWGRLGAVTKALHHVSTAAATGSGAGCAVIGQIAESLADSLATWREALIGQAPGVSSSALISVARDLEVLADRARSAHGRLRPPEASWRPSMESRYGEREENLSINIANRLWWGPSGDGMDPGVSLLTSRRINLELEEVYRGELTSAVQECLENDLLPEIKPWTIEDWLGPKEIERMASPTSGGAGNGLGLLLHSVQAEVSVAGLRDRAERMPDWRIGPHPFPDRIAVLEVEQGRSMSAPLKGRLPTVLSPLSRAAVLLDAGRSKIGHVPELSGIPPASLLLCRGGRGLSIAAIVLAMGRVGALEAQPGIRQFYFLDGEGAPIAPLAPLGDQSLSRALMQLIAEGRDVDGHPISLDALLGEWGAFSEDQRLALLDDWLGRSDTRVDQDMTLIHIQALIDRENGGLQP